MLLEFVEPVLDGARRLAQLIGDRAHRPAGPPGGLHCRSQFSGRLVDATSGHLQALTLGGWDHSLGDIWSVSPAVQNQPTAGR